MPQFAPKDPRWRDVYLEALRRVGVHQEAAAEAGVSASTVIRLRREDRAFAEAGDRALAEGRAASGLPPLRGWREAAAAREAILDGLRAGLDFKAACLRAGVPAATARRWRRAYPEWDLRAVTGPRPGAVLSMSQRDCPGKHCGTATGYDWGCFERACKDAKARQVMDGRLRNAGAPR